MVVILIDNYDSFTYNLYQVLSALDGIERVEVYRNDEITLQQIIEKVPTFIVLSPGPGNPENYRDFGVCAEILGNTDDIPVLGICLGHQGIGLFNGAKIVQASMIMHGKNSRIIHNESGVFANIPQNIKVARYHSLLIKSESLPDEIEITARTMDNEIMAIKHRFKPHVGLQFHPESFLTEFGREMLANFVRIVDRQKLTTSQR